MVKGLKYRVSVLSIGCLLICQLLEAQPVIEATGDQVYCPQSDIPIVTSFNITDPNSSEIEALHIQISTGYVVGLEALNLTGTHPNIVDTWNVSEGQLTLSGVGGTNVSYTDLIAAVYDVVYSSYNADSSGERYFSFTFGEGYYLPATGHHYLYVSDPGITWAEAKIAAETYYYLGIQGYLATITVPEEAQLTGTQVSGTGWIGGTDEESEGVWKWVTGPEAGTVFWNGNIDGSTPNYANWNVNEPNNCCGGEDYAHITAPGIGIDGSWNDLPLTGSTDPTSDYHPKGFVVEFGGMPGDPDLGDISASTQIRIPEITNVIGGERCAPGNLTLSATASEGDVFWFDSEIGGTQLGSGTNFTTPILSSSTTYYTMASLNGCMTGKRIAVEATIHDLPQVITGFVLKNCDEDGTVDGLTDFNLTEADPMVTTEDISEITVSYHLSYNEADTNSSALNPIGFNNAIASLIYARVENNYGCYSVTSMILDVSTTSIPSNYIIELDDCDDDLIYDGIGTFNLSEASQQFIDQFPSSQNLRVYYYRTLNDALLEINEIVGQFSYTNETAFNQILFVRVESLDNGECFGIGPNLILNVHPKPQFDLDESTILCLDNIPFTIETYNPQGSYTYQWRNESGLIVGNQSSLFISSGGNYSVTATSSIGCESFPLSINVLESELAQISIDDITIEDLSNNNTITINTNTLGIGDYEFSLSDSSGPYQDEPFFDHVAPGIHTLFVRDKNDCGITSIEVFILGFPKFFTPNNDGYHDSWNIKGWNQSMSSKSSIKIFDRYGKLLKELSPFSNGWNGTFNGLPLQSSDYWFVAHIEDLQGSLRTLKGNFSLVR